jgi:hypothetical protein
VSAVRIDPCRLACTPAARGSKVRADPEVTVYRARIASFSLSLVFASVAWAALSPAIDRALRDSTYVYIQSERKGGDFSKPAEIWYFYDQNAVIVGTRPTSWRVRRIKAGRARARIAVGKADGPTFEATGALVKDPALEQRMMEEFARKYPEGWKRYADSFRDGFKSGDRVLVRYTPR